MMFTFRNKRTGALLRTSCIIAGDEWVGVEEETVVAAGAAAAPEEAPLTAAKAPEDMPVEAPEAAAPAPPAAKAAGKRGKGKRNG